jgi:peptidoglycan/LPS O-acetylase OafA/YrhL
MFGWMPDLSSIVTGEKNARPRYRPDIDGLRAVAVLAVVAYHLFPSLAPGGFVGVDVFFVISGFLISAIIFESLAENKFSFLEFYAHRIRRIFPALIVVMAACLVFGWNMLLANEFIYLGKHIAASAGFVQNLVLWGESGYFDIASELKPLNHLWSLAIEEQFYLIFPLLAWVARRAGLNLMALVLLIGIASFAANVYATGHDPIGAFFSLQTRAWELMVGAVIALAISNERLKAFVERNVKGTPVAFRLNTLASSSGILAVLIAIFALDKTVSYPGLAALLPVLGAALILIAGPSALGNRILLSRRLPVFIGLISYPLYLWHWPLISYLTITDGQLPGLYERVTVAALSVALAWLTYRFVEQPLRRNRAQQGWTVGGLVCGLLILIALGINSNHFYRQYDERTQQVMQAWDFRGSPSAEEKLYVDEKFHFRNVGHNDHRKILFFGDSHADQYQFPLGALSKPRAPGGSDAPQVMFPPNTAFPPEIPAGVLEDRTITVAAFAYFWALNYYSEKVNQPIRCCGKGLMGTVGRRVMPNTPEQMDQLDDRLTGAVKALRDSGKEVYIVLDNAFGEEYSPRFMLKRSFFHGITIKATPVARREALDRTEPVRSRLMEIARKTGSRIIDPFEYLCDERICPVMSAEGLPVNKDYDHLSADTVINHVRYLDVLAKPDSGR